MHSRFFAHFNNACSQQAAKNKTKKQTERSVAKSEQLNPRVIQLMDTCCGRLHH